MNYPTLTDGASGERILSREASSHRAIHPPTIPYPHKDLGTTYHSLLRPVAFPGDYRPLSHVLDNGSYFAPGLPFFVAIRERFLLLEDEPGFQPLAA